MCTMTSVKTENCTFPGTSSSSKKLDVVDKWRARVLFCDGVGGAVSDQEDRDLCKKIEKHMAVLRVAYPFLTERQLRGKAWKMCGLKSIMGGIPRFSLFFFKLNCVFFRLGNKIEPRHVS